MTKSTKEQATEFYDTIYKSIPNTGDWKQRKAQTLRKIEECYTGQKLTHNPTQYQNQIHHSPHAAAQRSQKHC